MDAILLFFHWLVLTVGVGICLVIASCFLGLALMTIRMAWRTAGDDSREDPKEKPYTKLRRDE